MSVSYVESSVLVPAGSRTSVAIPVPTGVANKDIVTVGIYKENNAAITPPSGFTLKASDVTNVTTQGGLYVFWKRLTASDTGTYTFSWTGASYAGGHAIAGRGGIETGDPFQGSTSIVRTANNSGATVATSSDSIADGMAISFVSSWATVTRTWTAPSGWTREEQTINMATGEKTSAPATTTGTITWTGNGNDYYQMFLGVLKPVPVGTVVDIISSGTKKLATPYVISGGVKKAATVYVISGGVKK